MICRMGPEKRPHGQTWPRVHRRYGRTIHGVTYDEAWINEHSTWSQQIERNDVPTGRSFEVFRSLRDRFPHSKRILRFILADPINYDNIGLHWCWGFSQWHPWYRQTLRPPFLQKIIVPPLRLVAARIKKADVDWGETLIMNLIYSFSEMEIVPKAGACLQVLSVQSVWEDVKTRELRRGIPEQPVRRSAHVL